MEMKEYLEKSSKILDELQTTEQGLSEAEAARRLSEHGPNRLAAGKKKSNLQRFFEELKDPMILILLAAALISGITSAYEGESYADVVIILTVVIINAVLGVLQESKAEKAIEALQEIAAATSKVMRGGKMEVKKSEELVPGDIVILEAGDAVPADGRILESASMKIEEAALTGESVPVNKTADVLNAGAASEVPLGDRKNMVYMGSTVVYGRGRAVITGTGMKTEMGKIAHVLTQSADESTPLQKRLNQLSKILSVMVLAICAVIFIVGILKEGVTPQNILNTFMVAVSLAVAAIPEGLAAVVTIVLSIGVTKMSKRNAVIRKLTAVETLGCTQVICSDKTGTLTQNKMTVVKHEGSDIKRLVSVMALCSDAEPDENGEAVGEPTECALVNDAQKEGCPKKSLSVQYPRVGEAPFDSMRKRMTTIHRANDGTYFSCTKGAPDEITTTSADGTFSLSKPNDKHMLVVSFIGFENDTIHVSNRNETLDIVLREGVELSEVNVVSRKLGTMKLRNSVMNEDMISSAELSRAACCNLGESFVTNPSVDVTYSDAATGAKQIKLLGLSGTYVQMMTENIPNYRGSAAPTDWVMYPGHGCRVFR